MWGEQPGEARGLPNATQNREDFVLLGQCSFHIDCTMWVSGGVGLSHAVWTHRPSQWCLFLSFPPGQSNISLLSCWHKAHCAWVWGEEIQGSRYVIHPWSWGRHPKPVVFLAQGKVEYRRQVWGELGGSPILALGSLISSCSEVCW